jgi:hypothetical protein
MEVMPQSPPERGHDQHSSNRLKQQRAVYDLPGKKLLAWCLTAASLVLYQTVIHTLFQTMIGDQLETGSKH